MAINLQEFLDWYKKSEIVLWDKKWVFREPKLKDIKLPVEEILRKYCLEWDYDEFIEIVNTEVPGSKHRELIEKLLGELGLA